MRKIILTLTMLSLVLVAGIAPAQSRNGTVGGSVHDATQALIPGATVILANLETKTAVKTLSNDSGEYRFDTSPGLYELTVALSGFETGKVSNIMLEANQSKHFNLTLTIDSKGSGHVILIGQ